MAPVRSKKPKSTSSDNNDMSSQPSHYQKVAIKSPARTPIQSPRQKTVTITQGQKQALIDNLQLEGKLQNNAIIHCASATYSYAVTERARKLRAQYALQAQSLRTRIELRVNRIPTSIRKANMGELFAKYQERKQQAQQIIPAVAETEKPANDVLPVEKDGPTSRDIDPTLPPLPRGAKRKRYFISSYPLLLETDKPPTATLWRMPIKKMPQILFNPYQIPKSAQKPPPPPKPKLANRRINQQFYLQSLPTRAPFPNHPYDLLLAHLKNHIFRARLPL